MSNNRNLNASNIRLGFVSSRAMNVTPSGIWTEPGTGRMLDVLRSVFPRITVAMSDHGVEPTFFNTHKTTLTEQEVIPLPKMVSLPHGLLKKSACKHVLQQVQNRSDKLMIQLPFDSPYALRAVRLPTLYHLCADLSSVARSSRFRGPLRLLAQLAASRIDSLFSRLINDDSARLVALGQGLFDKYGHPRGKWVCSSVVSENEVDAVKRQRPAGAPFRILYVGYLRRWKGLDILFSAFRALREEVPNVELFVVGQTDLQEQVAAQELRDQVKDLEEKSIVRFIGHVPFGPELFQQFADADVFVLPSKGVEGTPRVLIEARAFGCPVIATDVGGVRSTVEDGVNGLIIPPNDVEACRSALLRILRDQDLRRLLIENGLERARKCTVEAYSGEIIEEINQLPSPSLERNGNSSC